MNKIEQSMKQHEKRFVSSHSGFLWRYNSDQNRWHKYFFAVNETETENKLCCFQKKIDFEQLTQKRVYGDIAFDTICKRMINQTISLQDLIEVVVIDASEFKYLHKIKSDKSMDDKEHLFRVKLKYEQFYFAADPNGYLSTQRWVNAINKTKGSQSRQNSLVLVRQNLHCNNILFN